MEANLGRDIIDYEENYANDVLGFEKYKVIYRRRKILEIMERFHSKNILEIGCGLEPLFCYVEGSRFTIVEPSDKFFENAEKLSCENKNVTCIKGFFEEKVNFLRGGQFGFDLIVCSSLLHEVPEPDKLLKAIRAVCNDKTIVHINVPNMYSMHRLLGVEVDIISNVFDKSEGNKRFQQNTNFDMRKLKDIVENNEMEVIEEGSYFIKPFSHKQMAEMLETKIINEKILDGLYNMTKYMPQFGSEIYVNCKLKG